MRFGLPRKKVGRVRLHGIPALDVGEVQLRAFVVDPVFRAQS
ncbi:MAG: hypothetical protein OXH68_21055 [Gammaproteobacteria bacterium]|nr:hypothetical protein [Gammaproteobacteria bacterium]